MTKNLIFDSFESIMSLLTDNRNKKKYFHTPNQNQFLRIVYIRFDTNT